MHSLIAPLNSSYKIKQNLIRDFSYVAPKQIYLGIDNFFNECFFYYVPIIETIKKLLLDESFFKIFTQKKTYTIDTFNDYNDGSVYKGNLFFKDGKKIEILLFQDSFEICNPLGSF